MNKLFLINEKYYVVGMDYYDAIVKFQKYKNNYDESIIEKIETVSDLVIGKVLPLEEEDDYEDEEK